MEGVSNETCSLAGHWGLGILIAFYDEFYAAIKEVTAVKDRPSLIMVTTTIGFGSPTKAPSRSVHGSALGAQEVDMTRKNIGWPYTSFHVSNDEFAQLARSHVKLCPMHSKDLSIGTSDEVASSNDITTVDLPAPAKITKEHEMIGVLKIVLPTTSTSPKAPQTPKLAPPPSQTPVFPGTQPLQHYSLNPAKIMKLLQFGFILVLLTGFSAIFIYITGIWNLGRASTSQLFDEDFEALQALQFGFKQCVSANGLGLQAVVGRDVCQVVMQFPSDTDPQWRDPTTGELEGLSYEFNLCEAVATWEQVRNSSTVLTREFIDSLPNGWEEYAWKRINKGIQLNHCKNKSLCMEKLSLVLPDQSPYYPRQFGHCAVIGNSGDLLKTKFGKEIDGYDAVFRENGAPIQNYTEYVGTKSTFRLLNRGSAKALDKVAELYDAGKEVLIIKTTIHDSISKMIREVPIRNPVYLMLGASFGSAAKGTGLKALEFALSICDTVDMYGFTVDPGYKEWTRYFSESRQGHTPLQGRAYYQMMECLGLIKIHSPMRADPNRIVKWVPSRRTLAAARVASEKILGRVGGGSTEPLALCSIIKKRRMKRKPRLAATEHQKYLTGVTMYPLENSLGRGILCTVPDY
ncbi:hypothetical protein Nepgr_025308 [Nepenthes gracilis]|uniref:Transketolase N-terminal domain-containing protein n=1 Tax=Nepenthes gracilis TaxID=150966 RepID=A0AAD3T4X6_NEPGR|nr:hypothetical protein Nepgr_025308 [Nepenthes gracilis]